MSSVAGGDEHVPHEPEVDEAVDDQLKRISDHASIDDLTELSTSVLVAPSAEYDDTEEAETRQAVNDLLGGLGGAVRTINEILAVLRDAGLIPPVPEEEV